MSSVQYVHNDERIDCVEEKSRDGGERLLHYVWLHRMWQPAVLKTTDGRDIQIINTGRINVHAGPDFFNATVRIADTIWVGNIEIHYNSSDWYGHGHHTDSRYNNVVLHVCKHADKDVYTQERHLIPQIEISVPEYVQSNYQQLINELEYPPCYRILSNINGITLRGWIDRMCFERMESKTARIETYLQENKNDWERTFFIALSRAFGFGVNAEVFERWAMSIPLNSIAHHRDNEFQVEAFFFGQAGMLEDDKIKQSDTYFQNLKSEYDFLRNKFNLLPIDYKAWKFLRMRPQNFPTIRLAQLAMLYVKGALSFSTILEADGIKSLTKLLTTGVSSYWKTHYVFGKESTPSTKQIQKASIQRLILNAICPVLFAYGRYSGKDELTERAFNLLEKFPAEDDRIVRRWGELGIKAENAADSQALIHMYNAYCQRKDCLRCIIGREYLKKV